MNVKVIEVIKDGKVGYLAATSIFVSANIVDNPMKAINYALDEFAGDLEDDLRNIRLPTDEVYAKSGILVDSAEVVEFEVELKEVSRGPVRQPRKMPAPR